MYVLSVCALLSNEQRQKVTAIAARCSVWVAATFETQSCIGPAHRTVINPRSGKHIIVASALQRLFCDWARKSFTPITFLDEQPTKFEGKVARAVRALGSLEDSASVRSGWLFQCANANQLPVVGILKRQARSSFDPLVETRALDLISQQDQLLKCLKLCGGAISWFLYDDRHRLLKLPGNCST